MRRIFERFLFSPAHPILLSIYFVFRLYAHNIHGVPPGELTRPLLVSVLAALFLQGVFFWFTCDRHKAAFMTSLSLVWFFLYGVARGGLASLRVAIPSLWLALIWMALVVLLLWRISAGGWKSYQNDLVASVNLTAIVLLLFPVMQSVRYVAAKQSPFPTQIDHAFTAQTSEPLPDIYYIILDGYGRSDAVSPYGYDNSDFLSSLRELGFYVAECSQSNYAGTGLSLTSALNMDYIQNLSDSFSPKETDLLNLYKMLENNSVRRSLTNSGYKTVAFASGFYWVEWRDADLFISPPQGPVSEFEVVVMLSTFARVLDDLDIVNLDDIHGENYRRRTLLTLDELGGLAQMPGPKFAFIHIIAPHEPSVFDKNGNPVPPDKVNPRQSYAEMAEFISDAILPGLEALIQDSKIPPVIILQGDHGPSPRDPADRMKILNAYFLPKGGDVLYPSITPVNSFRVAFNAYFDTDFSLLEDVSYFSNPPARYDFVVQPGTCPP
jgi:hypothetical protein